MTDSAIQKSRRFELVKVSEGRPEYPSNLAERGVTVQDWRVLVDSIFPSAKTTAGVVMAVDYCRARKLDIMKRPVHIVPMWNSKLRREVETVWPGISEIRTTAFRTGDYAGKDATEFGPTLELEVDETQEFKSGGHKTHKYALRYPEWAQVTVYRMVGGQRCAFVGPKVFWMESYAKAGKDLVGPNEMWKTRAFGQLDKCAEAAALRAAFPEELSGQYAAEEMEGRVIDVTPEATEPSKPDRNAAAKEAVAAKLEEIQVGPEEDRGDEPAHSEEEIADMFGGDEPPPPKTEDPIDADEVQELIELAGVRIGKDEGELWLRSHVRKAYSRKLERLPKSRVSEVIEAIDREGKRG